MNSPAFLPSADPAVRERIPDPNAPRTFEASIPHRDSENGEAREALYQRLLRLRQSDIVPRLHGVSSAGARAIGEKAVQASWRMGDGTVLTLASNLGREVCVIDCPRGRSAVLDRSDAPTGQLPGYCTTRLARCGWDAR